MRIHRKSHLLFVVCFIFCSVATMHGQSFSEQVETVPPAAFQGCTNSSSTQLEVSCTTDWNDPDEAKGDEKATASIADNGYGEMTISAYSKVTILVDGGSGGGSANGSDVIYDSLSILGLENEPIAYFKLKADCLRCWKYDNSSVARYYVSAGINDDQYSGTCTLPTSPNIPICTVTIPLVYCDGNPCPVGIERDLFANAYTDVANAPAGGGATTSIEAQGTATASVVDAKGNVIKGVTIVGASGHIYN